MKRFVCLGLFGLLVSVYLYRMRVEVIGIAAMLAYAAVFSLLLAPVCNKLEKRGMRRSWAAGYAVIGLFLIVFVMLAALIPQLVSRSFYMLKRIAPVTGEIIGRWKEWSQNSVFIQSVLADSGSMLGLTINGITGQLAKVGMTVAAQMGRIGFALILTYYILCDRRRIANHMLLFVPLPWRNPVLLGLRACKNAMLSYFSGMIKTSVFVSSATCAGLLVIGVSDAILLSLFMGVFEVLPYLGPILAAIPIVLSAMMQGTRTVFAALVVIVFVQQAESGVIGPYFTASSTSVHPLAAILAVYVLGSLMGFWGILLAIPSVVLFKSICWSWRQTRCVIQGEI